MALEALGGTCVFASEINAECVETYQRNFAGSSSHCAVAGDICAVAADTVPDHDILVGGFPCQPFSAAGLQPGFADESKGWLFLDIVRILKAKQPRLTFFLLVDFCFLLVDFFLCSGPSCSRTCRVCSLVTKGGRLKRYVWR